VLDLQEIAAAQHVVKFANLGFRLAKSAKLKG
jgi:hypothetical protein